MRPSLCRIRLLALDFRHLAEWMLFARCRKEDDRERNSNDATANERSHNALAQLSVSIAVRKDESALVGRDRWARRIIRAEHEHEQQQEDE
jgi:hypothetical protein